MIGNAVAVPNILRGDGHGIVHAGLAHERLERLIERGREKSGVVIQSLLDEAKRRQNYIVPADQLTFDPTPENIQVTINGHGTFIFTDHALSALRRDLHVRADFLNGLQADGEPGLTVARQVLNGLDYRFNSGKFVRAVDGQVKGFLSEDYKPIDQEQVIAGFVDALQGRNAFPAGGQITEWRYALNAIYNQILEPLPGEFLIAGVQLRSSDYGSGAVKIILALWRLICENLATGKTLFKQIHLGGNEWKIEQGFQVSHRTLELSARASVSAMGDAIQNAFSPQTIDLLQSEYRIDATKTLDAEKKATELRKKGMLRVEDEALLVNTVKHVHQIEVLPETENPESVLRFKQALAWIANSKQGEARLKLNDAAANLTVSDEDE